MTQDALEQALDELVHAAAQAPDTRWTLAALGSAVADLEEAAGAGLGRVDHDPLVVLRRRLGRVHGRLLDAAAPGVDPARVLAHRDALVPAPVRAGGRVAAAVRRTVDAQQQLWEGYQRTLQPWREQAGAPEREPRRARARQTR